MTPEQDEQAAVAAMEAHEYRKAAHLLVPLAEQGSEYALLSLGWIAQTGAIGPPDRNAARSYFERAAALGSAQAQFYLGRMSSEDGDKSSARAAFERGAQMDNEACKSMLIKLDDGVIEWDASRALEDEKYAEAINLLRPLAERQSEFALLALGWVYETGAAGPPDLEAARSHYQRAADNGSAPAYFELGRLLTDANEEAQARSAFEAGAERGDIPCMSRLGRMMVDGRGGPADVATGVAWLQTAAAKGHLLAQRTLLGLEMQEADAAFKKLAVCLRIAPLALKAAREHLKNPRADTVRA